MAIIKTIPEGSNFNPSMATSTGIGTIANYNASSRTFEVSNITFTQIKNAIGATATNLSTLSTWGNINLHALFRPDKLPAHSVSEFAGYNHYAKPPTYYYSKGTYVSTTKNSSFTFNFGVPLMRGERLPTFNGNQSASYWNYVRGKAVITDITNNRTITVYTPISTITQDLTNIIWSHTDNTRHSFSGSITITAEYVDNAGGLVYGQIEDSYPVIPISVNGYYTQILASQFTQLLNTDNCRIYYYKLVSAPSTFAIAYLTTGSGTFTIKNNNTAGAYDIFSMYMANGTTNEPLPLTLSGGFQIFGVFIQINNKTYRYSVNNYIKGDIIYDTHQVGTDVNYMAKLQYVSYKDGYVWPTTYPYN